MATRWPWAANARAVARPMPRLPPVMNTERLVGGGVVTASTVSEQIPECYCSGRPDVGTRVAHTEQAARPSQAGFRTSI